jgi:hypothetical protein
MQNALKLFVRRYTGSLGIDLIGRSWAPNLATRAQSVRQDFD